MDILIYINILITIVSKLLLLNVDHWFTHLSFFYYFKICVNYSVDWLLPVSYCACDFFRFFFILCVYVNWIGEQILSCTLLKIFNGRYIKSYNKNDWMFCVLLCNNAMQITLLSMLPQIGPFISLSRALGRPG